MEPLALAAHLLPCMMPRNSTMFSPVMAKKAFRRSRQAIEISSWCVTPLAHWIRSAAAQLLRLAPNVKGLLIRAFRNVHVLVNVLHRDVLASAGSLALAEMRDIAPASRQARSHVRRSRRLKRRAGATDGDR